MIDLSNLNIRQDIDRVHLLQWGHFCLLIMAFLVEGIITFEIIYTLVKLFFLLFFYKMFFKTVTDLYYSFWTFSIGTVGFVTYKLVNIISTQSDLQLFYLYLIAAVVLLIQMYILLSPIYYPRVSWWEYDFRYRDDLKVKLNEEGVELEARLTDLRRNAGCLSVFKDIKVGSKVKVMANNGVRDFTFLVEVMSRRQYSLGRPASHGVKFIFNEENRETDYDEFYSFWVKEKMTKKNSRFIKKVQDA
ncbi:hypothetical protein A9Q84_21005 [Halobacteriovorax marinus]|uniref:PilZ domain-containing protein n=1 Tax=Halobacteriovorax marinus TaxID=97084 RepID=A0A1Y5F1J1_9BACT|nr:hypothetical protein A9Q84_21005 [Halobacteriovorax marinus]